MSRSIEIREISDVSALDDVEQRDLADLRTALLRELSPDEPSSSSGWALSFLHPGTEVIRRRPLLAVEGTGRVVGQSVVTLDQAGGNTHIAEVAGVEVHPGHRRRGTGRALMAAAVRVAQEENRTSLVPWGVRSDASLAFWEALGLPEVSVDRLSRLQLDALDRNLLARWQADCTARERGYVIHRWRGRCPDELLPTFVAAQQGMLDAPTDDLDMEPDTLDAAWVRARERSWGERGGELWGMVATDPAGDPAAMTELITMKHRPSFVMQQGTTTLDAHRNRGLGRWLKAEMLSQLIADHPEAEVVETGNAASNAPMLAINEALGFQLYVELTVRQVAITDLVPHRS
ncbi:MAG: GNAT family N-acetyltransferase [Acidimicrobiales bacterium]